MKAFIVGFTLAAGLGTLAAWNETPDGSFNWNIFAAIVLWGTVLFVILVGPVLDRRRRPMFSTAIRSPWWIALIGWGIAATISAPLIVFADLFLTRAGVCKGWIEYHWYSGIFVCRRMAGVVLILALVGAALTAWSWARGRS